MTRPISSIAAVVLVGAAALLVWRGLVKAGPSELLAVGHDGPRAELVLTTFFGELLPGLRAAAEAYEREEGVRVHVQGIPYMSYEMWLRTQLLSQRPPEILLIESTTLPWFYGQAGMLLELSPAIARPNPFAPEYVSWSACIREPYVQVCRDATGQLWCLPFTEFGIGFFYNRDVYDQHDLTPPETWSELVANFRTLHEGGHTTLVTAIGPSDTQTIWIVSVLEEWLLRKYIPAVNIKHAPGWTFDVDDPTCTLPERIDLDERIIAFERGIIDPAQSPEYAEVLRLMRELTQHCRIEYAGIDTRELEKFFITGQSVHMMNGTWYLPLVERHMELMQEVSPERVFRWSTFKFPRLTDSTSPLETLGGTNQSAGMRASLIIPKQPYAPRQEQHALRFCQYLTSPRGMREIVAAGGVYDIPAVKGVAPEPSARPLLSTQSYAFLPVSALVGYDTQAISEFWTLWQRWFSGERSDRAFLDELSTVHRRSLARLYRRSRDQVDQDLMRRELGGALPAWLGD